MAQKVERKEPLMKVRWGSVDGKNYRILAPENRLVSIRKSFSSKCKARRMASSSQLDADASQQMAYYVVGK